MSKLHKGAFAIIQVTRQEPVFRSSLREDYAEGRSTCNHNDPMAVR